jgi:hypothetical protein
MKLRFLLVALGAVLLIALVAVLLPRLRGPNQRTLVASVEGARHLSTNDVAMRFSLLSKQHTNQCRLRAGSLETLAQGGRLQGACCSPMALGPYRDQLRGLENYRAVREVPSDPYDVSVALAKRLIGYRSSITLSVSEQAVYDRATDLAKEHGPCCWHCWRWDAFEGQAKFLIRNHGYASRQIASVWDLEDGCGGGEA